MGVKEDVIALLESISNLRKHPEKLRLALAVAFFAFGFVLVKMPLVARFEGKQSDLQEAKVVAANAEIFQLLENGVGHIAHRLQFPSSTAKWQEYYFQVAEDAGVGITNIGETATSEIYDFRVAKMQVTAIGSYAEIVAFIDALERGTRLVRLEALNLVITEGALTLRCVLLGITHTNAGIDSEAGDVDDEENSSGEKIQEQSLV